MKKIIFGIVCLYAFGTRAQTDPDTTEIESIREVLISADKNGEKRINISRQIEVIDAKKIAFSQQTNLGDVMQQTGQVYLQKSQQGGGSPVLRGFEASRVLLVVDGIRMNNATYRSGHLQDIVTVDPFMLDRLEVFFGSASTLYGSDALGGAIYMKTRNPMFSNDSPKFNLSATTRYGSAANAYTGNVQFNYGLKNVAFILNLSYNSVGDVRSGSVNYSDVAGFGDRNWYVKRIQGIDSVLANPNPKIQIGTGYNQFDIFGKLGFKSGKVLHTLGFQHSTASSIPRYDRLSTGTSIKPSFAVWNYSPQQRTMLSYQLQNDPARQLQSRFSLAVQTTNVGRQTRRYRNDLQKTQTDKVTMPTLNWDNVYVLNKKLKLQGGLEAVINQVESRAEILNVRTNSKTASNDTRYADGGSNSLALSAYAGAIYEVLANDMSVNASVREGYYSLTSKFSADNLLNLPYSEASFSNMATTFNLGVSKKVSENLYLKGNISSGFRNPNVDDLTKIFDSKPGTLLIVPNKDLKPERTITYDFSVNYNVSNTLNIEAGTYYTSIKNLLTVGTSTLNGQDSAVYEGINTRVYSMTNAATGYVQGMYIGGKVRINKNLYLDGFVANTYGRYKAHDSATEVPLDHIPPSHGRVGIRWVNRNVQFEIFSLFNSRKSARNYSNSGEDNPEMSPNGETPSWLTYNMRLGWKIDSHWNFTMACENIGDLRYRQFASGVNAPGRNFLCSINFKF